MSEQPMMQFDQAAVVALAQETQYAPQGIVSRTLMKSPAARLVLFGFDVGQELTEHTSPHQALVQILEGECEFSLAGEWRKLKAGDLLNMPPNLPHAVRATQRFSMLLTLLKVQPAK
jgi:quercetin dioxygenase-like cupin family protein